MTLGACNNLGIALGVQGPLYKNKASREVVVQPYEYLRMISEEENTPSNKSQEIYIVGYTSADTALRITIRTTMVAGAVLGLLAAVFAMTSTIDSSIVHLAIAMGVMLGISLIGMALHYIRVQTLNTSHFHPIDDAYFKDRDGYTLMKEMNSNNNIT